MLIWLRKTLIILKEKCNFIKKNITVFVNFSSPPSNSFEMFPDGYIYVLFRPYITITNLKTQKMSYFILPIWARLL